MPDKYCAALRMRNEVSAVCDLSNNYFEYITDRQRHLA
jgi:hypothetical protein